MATDAELLAEAGRGSSEAWEQLVDRYSQLIFVNARTVGASTTLAEDIVQVVWLKLLNRVGTPDQPTKLRGWLAIVARNATRNELRRSHNRDADIETILERSSTQASTELKALTHLELDDMAAAWGLLSAACQRMFQLLFNDGASYAEIAEVEQMPIGSVSKKRRTCLDELRTLMESGDD